MESLSEISSKWVVQLIANPTYLIAKSGTYLILYDSKNKKIVDYRQLDELTLKSERRDENWK